MANVIFKQGTRAQYDAIATKNYIEKVLYAVFSKYQSKKK